MNLSRDTITMLSLELAKKLKEQGFTENINNIDLYSEEDYAKIRMDYFGASDSSMLLNVNPFHENPYNDLIEEKHNKEINKDISKKASVRMGKDLEDLILRKLTEHPEFGSTDDKRKLFKPNIMFTKGKYNLSINYDGVLAIANTGDVFINEYQEYIPTEIKTVTKYGRKYYDFNKAYLKQIDGEWVDDKYTFTETEKKYLIENPNFKDIADMYGIPIYYFTQVQQQMLGTNSEYGYLAVLDTEYWDVKVFLIYKNVPCQIKLQIKVKEAKKDLDNL